MKVSLFHVFREALVDDLVVHDHPSSFNDQARYSVVVAIGLHKVELKVVFLIWAVRPQVVWIRSKFMKDRSPSR